MRRTVQILKCGFILIMLVFGIPIHAQEAVHNYGPMQIHDAAMVGFHMNLINDGPFDQNQGLVGFYGYDKSLTVSGTSSPRFFDSEILVDQGLYLETIMGITNNGNLITGDVITPRNNTDVFLNFNDNAFYVGENDVSHVDGYAAMTNKEVFTFPVGNDERLRPLQIVSSAINPLAKCAYFYEDPNAPSTFVESFDTSQKETEFLSVSEREFWHLEGDMPSTVTLSWDEWSNIGALAEHVNDIGVVGWHIEQRTWVNLGNTNIEGSMVYGSVTSETFVPNEFAIITLGGNDDDSEDFSMIELDNYYLTPNGDGVNDYLILEGIENSSNSQLQIYNRYGALVYQKDNYNNEFNGFANRGLVIKKGDGLPSGIYYYILTMWDLSKKHQGYMFLTTRTK